LAREFSTDEEIVVWADSLDERWPERQDVRESIVRRLSTMGCSQPTIVELCSGDGRLAKQILDDVPDAKYQCVDASVSLGAYVSRVVGVSTMVADLSGVDWSTPLEQSVDVIVTLQSMHDVGDGTVIERIYGTCYDLLSPGGVFLVADFVVAEDAFDPAKAGRLPQSWHLSRLRACGFTDVGSVVAAGQIECFQGVKST
jgi:SAM-dependent methyltransferase